MTMGTWVSVSSRVTGFVAPSIVALALMGCSADARDGGPTASEAVRAAPAAPVREASDTNENPDKPAGTKPVFSAGDFKDPGDAPAPSAKGPYAHLDPAKVVPKKLFDKAIAYFDANKATIPNQSYVGIVDFAAHSGKKRFFLIDMKTGNVRQHVVAHGKMSDPSWTGYATSFSNVEGSNKSSVGFAITGDEYVGAHGRSLRLEGLSATNSNMFDRAIVIHRADYVSEDFDKQGRSLGCFVFDPDYTDDLIDKLEGGALFYADLST